MLKEFDYRLNNIHFEEIDSTNNYAKRLIEEYRAAGKDLDRNILISADVQTAGRGRSGKSFTSPFGSNIYMTLILKLDELPEDCMLITPAVAVGALQALEAAGSERLGIKWVNDLFLHGKKVGGILTEAVFDKTGTRIEYAVIGIGIDIDMDLGRLPEELKEIVGSITGIKLAKKEMTISLAEHISKVVARVFEDKESILDIYRDRSVLIGEEVTWSDGSGSHTGRVVNINANANLVVDEAGTERILMSGEVSVRKAK